MLENPMTRLKCAAVSGKLSIVKRILRRFPELLGEIDPKNGWSLLHYASYHGRYLVCVYLIQNQTQNIGILRTFENNTCLHLALLNGHEQTAHLLLQHFPQCLNMKGNGGLTPAQLTCQGDHHQCLSLLLGLGADMTLRDDKNYTALHTCLEYGSENCLRLLVLESNLVNEENRKADNWTPEDLCKTFHVIEVYHKLLKEKETYRKLPERKSMQSMVSPLTIPKPVFENSGSPVLSNSPAIQSFASQLPPLPAVSTGRRASVGSQNLWSPKTPISQTFYTASPPKKKKGSILNRVNTSSSTSLTNRDRSSSSNSSRVKSSEGAMGTPQSYGRYGMNNKHSLSNLSMASSENDFMYSVSYMNDNDTGKGSRESGRPTANMHGQLSLLNIPVSKIRNRV
ncbi:LADA_0H19790g1_1 [Lachancea dasiensis]|uniref:LADA_0H19790g1_1 n=1 Tax=Lachancea dasiensis TaxID=1072105 RepID=A0A1G4K6G3_9SACH|nr:LADA_0H19790g1_1 [Lachancea dasiensis]